MYRRDRRPESSQPWRTEAPIASTAKRGVGLSHLVTHVVSVAGRRTSVRLEPVILDALRDIARQRRMTVHSLVSDIDSRRTTPNLSSAIRAYVVTYLSRALREGAGQQGIRASLPIKPRSPQP